MASRREAAQSNASSDSHTAWLSQYDVLEEDPEILLLFLLLRRQFRAVLDHQSGQLTQISSPEIPVPRLGREQRSELGSMSK